jgi:uncharacterized protein (TIGR02246 family)
MSDEQVIRELVERLVTAIREGDLDGVLAEHTEDVVMFDVPPPYQGIRGIADYRESWPPFFEWLASGALFELESLEVIAGSDAAFAYALLRCGTPAELAENPQLRLRLSLGLIKRDNRWLVQHEHHSFPIVGGSS